MYYLQGSKYNMSMVLLDDEIHKITPDHDLRYGPAQEIVIDLEFSVVPFTLGPNTYLPTRYCILYIIFSWSS